MGVNDINPDDLAALLGYGIDAPPEPEPDETIIERARREMALREAVRFTSTSEPSPYAHRAPPPEQAAPKARSWRDLRQVGKRDPLAFATELRNAHIAYAAAVRALVAGTCSQQDYDNAAHLLGPLLAAVCADEGVQPFLGEYLRDNNIPLTAKGARGLLHGWEQWRQRRAGGVPAPTPPAAATPPRTAAAPAPIPARPVVPEVRQPPPAAPVKRAAAAPAAPATAEDDLIWELHSEGLSVRAIERETGIPKSTVSRSINARRSMHP